MAVCVGINYPGTSAQLQGCVNDANDWAALLKGAGYDTALLLDGEATRAAIVSALSTAVAQMRWGDRLVFTYSGHGTWVPDRDGDEADQRDEALCPVDFREGRLITDDELQGIFAAVPRGANALILSDSCHSGTVARNLVGAVSPGRPRFVSPSEFTSLTEERAVELEARVDATSPRKTASLISGCADQEYSYDAWFGSRANGAMTRAAIDSYQPGVKLGAWFKAIRAKLPSADYPQTPQLTTSSAYRKYARAV